MSVKIDLEQLSQAERDRLFEELSAMRIAPGEVVPQSPTEQDMRAYREAQERISARAEQILLADEEYQSRLPAAEVSFSHWHWCNERRHRAQQIADNELNGANWKIEDLP